MMSPRSGGRVLLLVAAGASLACGQEQLVRYTFFQAPGFEVDLIVIESSDRRRTLRLTSSDFDEDGNRRDTRTFRTTDRGELVTRFWLIDGADTVSRGETRLDLRPDWRWELSVRRSDEDPTTGCFGCFGRAPFALAPSHQSAPGDSVWVVWGGNSISNPVVY